MFKEVIHVGGSHYYKVLAAGCLTKAIQLFSAKLLRKAVTYAVLFSHINVLLSSAYAGVTPLGPESRYDYDVSLEPTKGVNDSYNLVLRSKTQVLIEQRINFAQALGKQGLVKPQAGATEALSKNIKGLNTASSEVVKGGKGSKTNEAKSKPLDPEEPLVLQSDKGLVSYKLGKLGEVIVSSQGDITLRTEDSVEGGIWRISAKGQAQFHGFSAESIDLKAKSAIFSGENRVGRLTAGSLAEFTVKKDAAIVANKLDVKAEKLFNNGELSGQDLTFKAKHAVNQGYLIGRKNLEVATQDKFDNLGVVQGAAITIEASQLSNKKGASLDGKESLTLKGNTAANKGLIHSQGELQVATNTEFNNHDGGRIVTRDLQLGGAGQFINMSDGLLPETTEAAAKVAGLLVSGWTKFKYFAGKLINHGKALLGGEVSGQAAELTNHGQLQIDQAAAKFGQLNNDGSLSFSGQLQADTINNRSNVLAANGQLQVRHWFTNNGLAQLGTVSGRGTLTNEGELHLSSKLAVRDFINKRRLRGHDLKVSSRTFDNEADIDVSGKLDLGRATVKHSGHLKSKQLHINRSFSNAGDIEVDDLQLHGDRFTNKQGSNITVNKQATIKAKTVNNRGELRFNGEVNLQGANFTNHGELYVNDGEVFYSNDFINHGYYYRGDVEHYFNYLLNLGVMDDTAEYNLTQPPKSIKKPKDTKVRHQHNTLENRGLITGTSMVVDNAPGDIINSGNIKVDDTYLSQSPLHNTGAVNLNELSVHDGEIINKPGGTIKTTKQTKTTNSSIINKGSLHLDGTVNLQGKDLTNEGDLYINDGEMMYTNDFINRGHFYMGGASLYYNYLLNDGLLEIADIYDPKHQPVKVKQKQILPFKHKHNTLENRGEFTGAGIVVDNAPGDIINSGKVEVDGAELSKTDLINHGDFICDDEFKTRGTRVTNHGNMNLNSGSDVHFNSRSSWVNKGTLEFKGKNKIGARIRNYGDMSLSGDTTFNKRINNSGDLKLSGQSKVDSDVANTGTVVVSGNADFNSKLELNEGKEYRESLLVLLGDGQTNITELSVNYWNNKIKALGKRTKQAFKVVIDKLARSFRSFYNPKPAKGDHHLNIGKLSGNSSPNLLVKGAVQLKHYFHRFGDLKATGRIDYGESYGTKYVPNYSFGIMLKHNVYSPDELHLYIDELVWGRKQKVKYPGTLTIHGLFENYGHFEAKKLIIDDRHKKLINEGTLAGDYIDIYNRYVETSKGDIIGYKGVKVRAVRDMNIGSRKKMRDHWYERNSKAIKSGGTLELESDLGVMDLEYALLMAAGPIYIKSWSSKKILAKMLGLESGAYFEVNGHDMVAAAEDEYNKLVRIPASTNGKSGGDWLCSVCGGKGKYCHYNHQRNVSTPQSDPAFIRVTGDHSDLAPYGKAGGIYVNLDKFTLDKSYLEAAGKITYKRRSNYTVNNLPGKSKYKIKGVVKSGGNYRVTSVGNISYDGRGAKMPKSRLLKTDRDGTISFSKLSESAKREKRMVATTPGNKHLYKHGTEFGSSSQCPDLSIPFAGLWAEKILQLPNGQAILANLPEYMSAQAMNHTARNHLGHLGKASLVLSKRFCASLFANAKALGKTHLSRTDIQNLRHHAMVKKVEKLSMPDEWIGHYQRPASMDRLAEHLGIALSDRDILSVTSAVIPAKYCTNRGRSLLAKDFYAKELTGVVKSDGDIIHDIDGTLNLAQAVMEADGDIELYADKLVFAPGYTHTSWSDGKNSHSSTTVHPSKFKGHNITVMADDDLEDTATEWIAAGNLKFISRYGNVIGRAAFNTSSSSYQDKKHSSSSSSSTAVTPKYRTGGSLTIESPHGSVNMQAPEMQTNGIKFVTPHGDVNLIAVYDKRSQSSSNTKKGLFKIKFRSSGSSSATARECVLDAGSGEVEFDVGGLVRAEVRAKGSVLKKLLSDNEFDGIVYRIMTDQQHSYRHKQSRLSANVVTLISLAAAMAVPGVGEGVAGAIITAGLKTAASQLAVKTAEARGNVLKGMSRLREKGSIKAVFRSMAVAGLTASILGNVNADASADLNSLPQRFVSSAVKSTINMALDVTVDGVKPSAAMKTAAKQTITETVSRTISSQLGKLYHGGALPDGLHEVLHGASAYTIEKFHSGSTKKAKSAAAGAISAEVFTKLYTTNATVFNNPDATPDNLDKAITTGIELAQLTAASVATALNLNAEVAANAAYIAARENSYGAYFPVPHMNDQVDLEEAEEELSVLEKVAQALRNMAGLREDERQGRSRNRNATGAMAKRENSPERSHEAKVAQAEDWGVSKVEQLFEHSRKSFDAVKPGEIEDLMWAKTGVTLIEGITACVDSLDDWSGTMLSTAADLLDKAAATARTAVRRTARDDLGMSQKNAQDLGDGTTLAVSIATLRPFIKSARFLGQTAKEAKLIKGANNSSKLGFRKELAKDYIREIEKATGYSIPDTQRLLLKKDLQQNKYVKLEGKDKIRQRRRFNNVSERLREEWKYHTKQDWPTYEKDIISGAGKVSRSKGKPYDVHELIPNSHGGPLEWWNVHPARFPDQHQRIIHGKDSVINKILKELKDK